MLVRYKKSLQKIAMGLLSLMPSEKNIKKLTETIDAYAKDETQHLYLWKQQEEYVGIVGVAVEGEIATLQHICVVPSYRGEGIATQILQELTALGIYKEVCAIDDIQPLFDKCMGCIAENR